MEKYRTRIKKKKNLQHKSEMRYILHIMAYNNILYKFTPLFFLFFTQCFNPFFPKIDNPNTDYNLLLTPEGVIRQLQISYERNRLEQFKDLIYNEDEFRFYIQYNPHKAKNLKKIINLINLDLDYVPKGEYWYLNYNQELNIHKNLLSTDNSIEFPNDLSVIESRVLIDSLSEPDNPDTTVLVRTAKTKITITSDVIATSGLSGDNKEFTFTVGEQKFLLKKDTASQEWRIALWFELDPK